MLADQAISKAFAILKTKSPRASMRERWGKSPVYVRAKVLYRAARDTQRAALEWDQLTEAERDDVMIHAEGWL